MGKGRGIIILLALVVGVFLVVNMTQKPSLPVSLMPHGYDGIVSSVYDIEHDYAVVSEFDSLYWAGIDPDYGGLPNPSGIRIQISAPQYLSHRNLEDRFDIEFISETLLRNTSQKVSIFTFEMSATIQTYGVGWLPIRDVTFWIDLQNNDYTVFTNPDEIAVAIISVVAVEGETAQEAGGIEIAPEGDGYDAALETVEGETVDVPPYAEDMVNVENFNRFQHVRFPIEIFEASPVPRNPPIDYSRVEAQHDITFEIDVVVIGEWVELRPYHKVIPPEPDLTIWDILADILGLPVYLIALAFTFIFLLAAGVLSLFFIRWGKKYGVIGAILIFVFFVWLMFETGLMELLGG